MKPCPHCGEPISNEVVCCDQCQKSPAKVSSAAPHPSHRGKHRVTTFNVTMFLLEILITAVIISIPLGVVCSLVALFFFPNWWAVAYGFLFGFAAGVLFGLLRTYFFAQSLRKPLQ